MLLVVGGDVGEDSDVGLGEEGLHGGEVAGLADDVEGRDVVLDALLHHQTRGEHILSRQRCASAGERSSRGLCGRRRGSGE